LTEHEFTSAIEAILRARHGETAARQIMERSDLIGYLNIKTRSANRGSKSRGSFANLYAIYVLVEDYIANGYLEATTYSDYAGARFTDLLKRQRELPFGSKLQNHALNNRLNDEFRGAFPLTEYVPVLRDLETSRYWINEGLLRFVSPDGGSINLAPAVIEILDAYVQAKRDAFDEFLATCRRLTGDNAWDEGERRAFINALLAPEVDARIFEIVSFAILKAYYGAQSVWIGSERETVEEKSLVLYKTGTTNANDGGIDFVLRPLGRFYQVTETLDLKKYFLDIDKTQRFPITFVVKSDLDGGEIRARIEEFAKNAFTAKSVVTAYMDAVEDIINIGTLRRLFAEVDDRGLTGQVATELIAQARAEWHLTDDDVIVDDIDVAAD
jgi:hypothetical protein